MLLLAKLFTFCHKGTKAQRKNNKDILCVLVPGLWQYVSKKVNQTDNDSSF
jgi:hypothetical protein